MGTNIGNVGSTQNYYNQYSATQKTGKDESSQANTVAENPVDTYTPSAVNAKDPATIERLWNETDHAAEAVRKLVSSMLGKNDATGQTFWASRARGGKVDEATQAKAQEMIGEDGFFGVKQTSERIMGFAKALVGEDASEEDIEKMRGAVQKGFDEVAKMFGGFDKLPEVTKQTYDSIMKSFDDWKSGGAAEETSAQ